MFAPIMSPLRPNPISIYFPKRLLLSLRVVFALPIACKSWPHVNKQHPPTPERSEVKFQYLHDGIWCQDFLLHTGLLGRTTHNSKVAHGEFSRYSFTWAWFSTDYDGLVFLLSVCKNMTNRTMYWLNEHMIQIHGNQRKSDHCSAKFRFKPNTLIKFRLIWNL